MKVKVITPKEVFIDSDAVKIIAEAENGYFTILPRHADFSSTLVPSILTIEEKINEKETKTRYFAVDVGTLVKIENVTTISCFRIIEGNDLEHLAETVKKEFLDIKEEEKKARTAVARLEGNMAKLIMDLH